MAERFSMTTEAVMSFLYANSDREFTAGDLMEILDMGEQEAGSWLSELTKQGLLQVGFCSTCNQPHYRLRLPQRPN